VTLVAGPTALPTPTGVSRVDARSARDMATAVDAHVTKADIFIAVAAVADYTPAKPHSSKLKKTDAGAYARFFAPKRAAGSGPSGLVDPPRPFVFRMLGPLEVGMNLFLTRDPAVDLFTQAMAELGTLGSVAGTEPVRLPLSVAKDRVGRVRVHFLTPT
jgi:hypothetical protein